MNLDKSASDNFFSSPVLQVAITLKFWLKFLNSLFSFVVNVPGMSSTKVKLCLPENNSLNLSNTIVFTWGISFKINDFLLRIADNIKPGLNSISMFIKLFSFIFSSENNFFFKLETATKNDESGLIFSSIIFLISSLFSFHLSTLFISISMFGIPSIS